MQAFSAGAFEAAFKSLTFKPLPQICDRDLQSLERNTKRGVKVEDQAVGIIDCINGRAPRMDLDGSHLNEFEQTLFVVDIQIFVMFALVPKIEGMDVFAKSSPRTALIKTVL